MEGETVRGEATSFYILDDACSFKDTEMLGSGFYPDADIFCNVSNNPRPLFLKIRNNLKPSVIRECLELLL